MDVLANGSPWLLLFCSEMLHSLSVARRGRHERKEERKDSRAGEKDGVLLMLTGSKADGQSQMDALGWQGSHNSYCSGCWLPSPVNCVAWSALPLSLSSFYRFFPVWTASCGWLLISQPFGCITASLKMAERLSSRWTEKADDERGALKEGHAEGDREGLISGSLHMQWM